MGKNFFRRWLITTVAVLVAAHVVDGISYDSSAGLVVASLLLGIFNALLRPILMFLTLPLMIVTLGLFTLVINAALFYFVSFFVKSFHVDGFWPAFWGALVVSLISLLLQKVGKNDEPSKPPRRDPPPGPQPGRKDMGGSGPVIDV